ncbi:hypothetical protein L1987_03207 [Smallanthus sonchifolius]|uniref:Uncharacterized protein n=1 Tax=Smallanthus sonchifolius TaxID=185202 RepID=A0ACB9KA36_9ASTR|nr:hypothetical protein L1987_03207 [Smallanthus sonchifolius]
MKLQVEEVQEPDVKIPSLTIISPDRPDIVLEIPTSGNPKAPWFTLKEGSSLSMAIINTRAKIETCSFPGAAYSPYRINPAEVDGFLKELQKIGLDKAAAVATENVLCAYSQESSITGGSGHRSIWVVRHMVGLHSLHFITDFDSGYWDVIRNIWMQFGMIEEPEQTNDLICSTYTRYWIRNICFRSIGFALLQMIQKILWFVIHQKQ